MNSPLPVLMGLIAVLLLELSVMAAPIRVRARSVVSAEVHRSERGLALRGRLSDERGEAIVGAPVHAEIQGMQSRVVRSGEDGRFELTIEAADAVALGEAHGESLSWRLDFSGGPNFGPVSRTGALALKRTPTRLELSLDRKETSRDDGPISIEVAVRAGAEPVGNVPVHLRVADGPELVGDADAQGRLAFLLRPRAIRRFGPIEVEARFPGNVDYASSEASERLTVSRATRLTLRVGREGSTHAGRYRFSGRLSSERGALVGQTVAIVAKLNAGDGGAEVCQRAAVTDSNGVFITAIPAREFIAFEGETVEIQALFQPSLPSLQAARSQRAVIPIPELPGVPLSWYFACLAAGGGLVLLGVAFHLRFWEQLRWRWRRRRLRRHVAGNVEGLLGPDALRVGASGGRPDWLSGTVIEREGGALLRQVEVSVSGPGLTQRVCPDAEGRFELGPLQGGSWRLEVRGPGLIPRSAEVRLPHGGELDGMAIRVQTARARIRDLFLRWVADGAPEQDWGIHPPSEIALSATSSTPEHAGKIASLRRLVERSWFGPGEVALDEVRVAEAIGGEREEAG